MKNVLLGTLFGVGLMIACAVGFQSAPALAGRSAPDYGGTASLITLTSPVDDHRQQLTIIDPEMRVMGIYHVQRDSGELSLKSVRNFHWDLQMIQFNGTSPLPREIRSLLEQQ